MSFESLGLEAELLRAVREQGYDTPTPIQAQAILDLRLHRLTGLEQDKIINEYKEILGKIKDLSDILADADKLLQVIRDELA